MREKKLPPRLAAIAEFVRSGASVCDVGTDHAFLPCLLAKNGWEKIYACDINENPLNRARTQIEKRGLTGLITLLKSDGLLRVPPCDDVIIAGMGGELIAEIIGKCPFTNENTRFILQPMTKRDFLREWLCKSGFEVIGEKIVSEKNKTYLILYVKLLQ